MKDRNGSGAKGLPHCADDAAATTGDNAGGRTAVKSAKPFPVSKRQVWEAYKRVKANRGAAGIDGQTLAGFDENVTDNLYKLWNRMASGSYIPQAVRRVDIPKADGGVRPLGIPAVSDRIAQMVVKQILEPVLEPLFHVDSYGYRPGKSAHQAIAQARKRCWKFDWVVMYIECWLKAPVQMPDGATLARDRGRPQGGVISPCSQICSCAIPLICGCNVSFPAFPSKGTPMMLYATVTATGWRVLRGVKRGCLHSGRYYGNRLQWEEPDEPRGSHPVP